MCRRNYTIDLAKYIASLMVIAIHTAVLSDVNETVYFAVVHVICRLAVPFFAVCSGYFLANRCLRKQEPELGRAAFLRQWKKLAGMYVVWSMVYLVVSIPFWVEIGWFSAWAFVDYAIAACTKGSYYHLWYLWGMVYTLPVFYAVMRRIAPKYWKWIVAALWLMKITGYAYGSLLPDAYFPLVQVMGKLDTFLCLLPLLLLGAIISQEEQRNDRLYAAGFWISLMLLFAEAFALKKLGQGAVSYIFFTLPTAYFLFHLLLQTRLEAKNNWMSRLAEVSLFIYCVHPVFEKITDKYMQSSVMQFLLCAALSTAAGRAYSSIKSKRA